MPARVHENPFVRSRLGHAGRLLGAILVTMELRQSRLDEFCYLQPCGSRFTESGVQVLGRLKHREDLQSEEETFAAAAFRFAVDSRNL